MAGVTRQSPGNTESRLDDQDSGCKALRLSLWRLLVLFDEIFDDGPGRPGGVVAAMDVTHDQRAFQNRRV